MAKKENGRGHYKAKLDEQIVMLTNVIASMEVTDDKYEAYTKALNNLIEIRNKMNESDAKCIKDRSSVLEVIGKTLLGVGSLTLTFLGLKIAYDSDIGDKLLRNKATASLFAKMFPPRKDF